jgi:hypothetical protein
MNRRSTFVRRPRRLSLVLCLLNAHRWGRLEVITLLGVKRMFEHCDRCGVMRQAVTS